MSDNRIQMLKRIRLVGAIVAGFIFGSTGWQQLAAEGLGPNVLFILISTALGFAFLWIVMTIVIYIVRAFGRNRE